MGMTVTETWRTEVVTSMVNSKRGGRSESLIAQYLTDRYGAPYTENMVRGAWKRYKDGVYDEEPATAADPLKPSFLLKARTAHDIARQLGLNSFDEVKNLVHDRAPKGHNVFQSKDNAGRVTYVYIPKFDSTIDIAKRDWKVSVRHEHAYMVADLDVDAPRIKVIPVFDAHYGHHAHRNDKFLDTLNYIKNTPGVFAICGGDLVENALDDGRGFSYEQTINPRQQWQDMTEMLAPLADKILMMHPGNHEKRTSKKAGVEITEYMAKQLNVPYFAHPARMRLKWQEQSWGFRVFHGKSAAGTPGGRVNAASKPRIFHDFVEFIVSGHVHEALVSSQTCITENKTNFDLEMKSQFVVVANPYLGYWNTYAHEADYPPPSLGAVGMHMYPDGKYDATFKPEH